MSLVRFIARFGAGVLPARTRALLARWRFGHHDLGARQLVERQRDGDRVTFTIDGRLTIAAEGEAIGAVEYHFVEDGDSRTEMASLVTLSSAAPADALLLDVGAHIGLFSVVHLALGPRHRAVLFEPSPPLSSASAAWLAMNGMTDRGQVRCAGVGDTVDTRMIETDSLGFASEARDQSSGTPVPFTSIDHLCRTEGLRPAIIKIDVEGYEAEVINGARETLHSERPILCLELHLDVLEQRGKLLGPLLDTLEAAGYRFESTTGTALPGWYLRNSVKAISRVVARPMSTHS